MMSKFKQLRLRLVVAVAVLLMAGMGTEAFAQCYTKNLQQAESLYKQGRYAEAKKRFAAAKACPDKPKTNNLDSRIAACNRKINERSSSSTQPSRRQSTPSTTSRTHSFTITSVSFRNEDIDDNVLNAYGERLCAADVHYLMPRIYYKSTYSSSQDWAFKYKIYKPDGTLMSGSTSPSGYTNSFEMTVDPGENYCGIGGWGRSGGGAYDQTGQYRFEVWRNGSRIYQQNFTLYSGSGNVSDGTLKVDGKTSVSTNFSSSGGTERFTVSGVSSWDTWGIPSWCSVENRTSTSFTLRCEANNSSSSRSDYMKITSGSQEVRIDITQDASASRFSGNVENVWVDYDQWQNGKKGMLIHVKFTVDGMRGREGKCVAYFKYEGGDFLKDYNNDYGTTGGQVCCPDSFTPNYDSTRFSDFRLFMPYDELHMAKGKYDLAFHILIYDQDTQEDIVRSSDQNFTFTQN